MFSRIREHFGTAGLVVAIVALVAALGGAAVAASGGNGGGKATASAKGKQGPRGKTGPSGPQGPAGPAGAAGKDGAPGSPGEAGEPGAKGATGAQGLKGTTGAEGPQGVTGPAGSTGATGPEGVCSAASACVLPKGVPLSGTWSTGPYMAAAAGEPVFISISLNIPASSGLLTGVFMKEGETEDTLDTTKICKGGVGNPVAEPTGLGQTVACIFVNKESNLTVPPLAGNAIQSKIPSGNAKKSGVLLEGKSTAAGPVFAHGTWVVMTKP